MRNLMSAKRRSRRDVLLREIEGLREISFPIPTKGDAFEKEVLEKTKDGIVRGAFF
jgi:hypothetical protein